MDIDTIFGVGDSLSHPGHGLVHAHLQTDSANTAPQAWTPLGQEAWMWASSMPEPGTVQVVHVVGVVSEADLSQVDAVYLALMR
jgi:hypothetical protein